jgi:hypothetical protein
MQKQKRLSPMPSFKKMEYSDKLTPSVVLKLTKQTDGNT